MLLYTLDRLKYLYRHSDPIATEIWLYSVAIFIGIWFANPFYNLLGKTKLFSGISGQSVELGLLSVTWGFLGTIALAHNWTALRKLSAFSGALFWIYLSSYSIFNDPLYSSFPLYVSVAMQSVWLFFKIKPGDK